VAATRTTIRHQLNRTHELAIVQPLTALQIPQNLTAPALSTPNRGHAGNQNPLVNRIDAPAKTRAVEVKHATMTEVLDVPTRVTTIDAIVTNETTAVAEDAQAIVLEVMVNPNHIHPSNAMNNVQTLHASAGM
jgi:hypothetical protein